MSLNHSYLLDDFGNYQATVLLLQFLYVVFNFE